MSVLHTTASRIVSVLSGRLSPCMTHGPLCCKETFIRCSPPMFYTGGIFHRKFQLDSSLLNQRENPDFFSTDHCPLKHLLSCHTMPIVQCGRRSMPDSPSCVNLNRRGFCLPASASLKNMLPSKVVPAEPQAVPSRGRHLPSLCG